MPDIRNAAALYIDTADNFAQVNMNQADYMSHIVSHFTAERMKHVKQYFEEVLSNYRADGPARSEHQHNAVMTGKTKATSEGSPVEIKEIKRITNYATSVAGGQCYQPGGRFLVAFSRRGYFLRNSSSANLVGSGSVSGGICLARAFSCWREMILCKSNLRCSAEISSTDRCFLLIVQTCKAVRCSTSYHSAGIFRTDFALITSDHLSKKAAYTEAIPYKTGIGRRNPFNQYKATQARPASFFVSFHRATIPSGKARTVSMVALVGQPKGWPVSLYAGIPTPASVTALYERRNSSGDSLKQYKEAFHMAVSARPYFVWRFIAFGASDHQIIHVTAWTEREARNRCPSGCVAVFVARIRQEVSHG